MGGLELLFLGLMMVGDPEAHIQGIKPELPCQAEKIRETGEANAHGACGPTV